MKSVQLILKIVTHVCYVFKQIFFFDNINHLKRCCWTSSTATESRNISKVTIWISMILLKSLKNFLRCNSYRYCSITRRQTFCSCDNVRLYIKVLITKPFSRSTKSANYLINVKQNVIFFTNRLNNWEILWNWRYYTATSSNRLKHN